MALSAAGTEDDDETLEDKINRLMEAKKLLRNASYRAEKQAAAKIQLPDADAEIEAVPTTGGGRKPEPDLDRLSNILKAFNEKKADAIGVGSETMQGRPVSGALDTKM